MTTSLSLSGGAGLPLFLAASAFISLGSLAASSLSYLSLVMAGTLTRGRSGTVVPVSVLLNLG